MSVYSMVWLVILLDFYSGKKLKCMEISFSVGGIEEYKNCKENGI